MSLLPLKLNPFNSLAKLRVVNDLLHLVYPCTCVVCERELAPVESMICSFCSADLTYTDYHLFEEATPMDQLFWGRIPVVATYAHLHFKKSAGSQRILFNLKYKNKPGLGVHFGKEMGRRLISLPVFQDADCIIPVPLHHKKKFIRGYNQSEMLAMGISEESSIPMNKTLATRNKHTATQTKKNRFQRWDNVNSIFSIKRSIRKFRHVILVDDVVTTGSTLEALSRSLLEINPDLKISIVTLAIA